MLNAALYERTQILVGDDGIRRLQSKNVFLAGVGGVGGHCAEALVRAGIGAITLCDHDVVSSSNKNRQLIAMDSTIGKSKVMALAKRLSDINSHCRITALDAFILPEDASDILRRQQYDAVVDCIDSVECKVALLAASVSMRIATYASCGAGGRMNPHDVSVGDLFETENDALAKACRTALRSSGVGPGDITVVHSREIGRRPLAPQRQECGGRDRAINGTISYMPPLFGLLLASAVLRDALDSQKAEADRKRRRKQAEKVEKLKQRRIQNRPTIEKADVNQVAEGSMSTCHARGTAAGDSHPTRDSETVDGETTCKRRKTEDHDMEPR